ncbi:MAG: glycosyltransferase, partial [Thermoanaerobacteraceae bacterium]|nr:glycosyltransferase [Thermoanaerobacteraceae bacterium]
MSSQLKRRLGIIWEGSFFVYHSLALVNRELVLELLHDERFDIGIKPYEPDQFDQTVDPRFALLAARFDWRPAWVDFTVRHRWPPLFQPAEGRLIWIQPWEYGSVPVEWARFAATDQVAEIWVPSSFVRDCYIQSGVEPEKVSVVPNGVNTAVFNPQAAPLALSTQRSFKFLFVGGTIPRKGPDVLLKAYFRVFSAKDDVCLVVKDFGTDSFYRGQGLGTRIEELRRQKNAPEVLYLNNSFGEAEMAGLYRACDCLVHPYRGEGFGLPVAEAMACGLPVIVTNYGACLDFCNDKNALLINASVVQATEKRAGNFETVGYPYWAEPDVEHLAHLMRWVYENPVKAQAIGLQAVADIQQKLTWDKAAAKAKDCLWELIEEGERGIWVAKAMKNKVEELLEQGFQAYTAGKRGGAQKLFEQALAAAPDNADVNYNLGLLYLEKQKFAPAVKFLLSSLESNVNIPEAWTALGSALAGLGDYGSAKIAYESALRLDPGAAGASENLALVRTVLEDQPDTWESGWYRTQVMRLAEKLPVFGSTGLEEPVAERAIVQEEEADLARITAAIAHAFEAPKESARMIKEEILPFFRGCDRVLDIGCGEGLFLEMLREIGIEGEGIDLDPVVVEKARAKGLRVKVASALEHLARHQEVYDGMMLGHIIEHFSGPDAVKLLYYCARALRGGGIIAIQTPNFLKPEVPVHNFWLDITHVRPYPPALLEVILRALQFEILANGVMEISEGFDVLVVGRKRPETAALRLDVVWRGHIYEESDFGDEARRLIFALNQSRPNIKVIPEGAKEDSKGFLTPKERKSLKLMERFVNPERSVVVHHFPVFGFRDKVRGAVNVGRTMFELDRIKPEWARHWNRMDEIWVPSRFNVETFSASGVDREKLRVVPEGIDAELFNPQIEPLDIRGNRGFIFLANFDLEDRTGWDILLTAYLTEFRLEEDVSLLFRTQKIKGGRPGTVEKQLASFIQDRLGFSLDKVPEVILLKGDIKADRMPRLYTACDAFVLPSRGEAWGRPYLEAMACGLPTIGTRWSGNLEFMNDANSYLIEIEGLEDVPEDVDIPVFRGHRWAKPSVEHLRQLMRYVFEHREEARLKGRKAREDVV